MGEKKKKIEREKEKKSTQAKINCLVYPYNKPINYILSKLDKQKHFLQW